MESSLYDLWRLFELRRPPIIMVGWVVVGCSPLSAQLILGSVQQHKHTHTHTDIHIHTHTYTCLSIYAFTETNAHK